MSRSVRIAPLSKRSSFPDKVLSSYAGSVIDSFSDIPLYMSYSIRVYYGTTALRLSISRRLSSYF